MLSEKIGLFIGAIIGKVIQVAGPQIEDLLFSVATRILDSRAEFSGKNKILEYEFNEKPRNRDSSAGLGT